MIPRLVALVGIWTLVPVLRAALRLLTRGMTDADRWERLGGDVLWETVEKDDDPMVRPLRDLPVDEYWPEHGVGGEGRRFVYGGYLARLMRRMDDTWALRWRLPLGPNGEAAPRTPGTPPPCTTA